MLVVGRGEPVDALRLGCEVDAHPVQRIRRVRGSVTDSRDVLDEVLLAGLSHDEAVGSHRAAEAALMGNFLAQRHRWHVPFDLRRLSAAGSGIRRIGW